MMNAKNDKQENIKQQQHQIIPLFRGDKINSVVSF